MAALIRWNGPLHRFREPLTITRLQELVGGFVKFLELPCGDYLATNEDAMRLLTRVNKNADVFVGIAGPVYGDVVLFGEEELA